MNNIDKIKKEIQTKQPIFTDEVLELFCMLIEAKLPKSYEECFNDMRNDTEFQNRLMETMLFVKQSI